MAAISVDLPTFGNPTRATSASSLSSSRSQRSSPTSPCSAKDGARRRFDRNRALPRPPCPPAAARHRSPAWTRSASTAPVVVVAHDRALGHRHDGVVAAGAVALLALAVGAVAGAAVRVVAEGEQRRDVAVGDEPDVAAVAAVAAVGPALGDVGLAAERDGAGTAVAALDVEVALVDEPGHPGEVRGSALSEPGYSFGTSRTGSPLIETDHVVRSPRPERTDDVADAPPRQAAEVAAMSRQRESQPDQPVAVRPFCEFRAPHGRWGGSTEPLTSMRVGRPEGPVATGRRVLPGPRRAAVAGVRAVRPVLTGDLPGDVDGVLGRGVDVGGMSWIACAPSAGSNSSTSITLPLCSGPTSAR